MYKPAAVVVFSSVYALAVQFNSIITIICYYTRVWIEKKCTQAILCSTQVFRQIHILRLNLPPASLTEVFYEQLICEFL